MNSVYPFISILVPIYGVEKYIERCARSLFEQTYSNLEFVFVDDVSPDKSVEILRQVAANYPQWDGHVTIIQHEKNSGVAATRNTLVDNCKGEFLLHVDSDDWIEPNAVELLVNKQLETDADIVTGLFYRHTSKEKNDGQLIVIPPFKEKDREEMLRDMLEIDSIVAIWNRLIRSSLFRDYNIRWVEGIDAGEDLMITPRLVYFSQKVAFCNALTYHYNRTNANSYVSVIKHNWNMQLQLIRACQMNVAFFRDKEVFYREAMDKQLVKRLGRMLKSTFINHNRQGYEIVLAMLDDSNRKYWMLIGWDRIWKRWLDRHYSIKRTWKLLKSFFEYDTKFRYASTEV